MQIKGTNMDPVDEIVQKSEPPAPKAREVTDPIKKALPPVTNLPPK